MKYTPFFGCMMTTKYPQFEAAVRKSVARVGLELVDVDGFSCCPDPIYFHASNKIDWYTVAARNLSLAEDVGNDIITTCSGCTATLSEVNLALKEDSGLKDEINKNLKKIGKEFKGSINVRHAVTVLRDDFQASGWLESRGPLRMPSLEALASDAGRRSRPAYDSGEPAEGRRRGAYSSRKNAFMLRKSL
jgi:heterodisulfide reductase subunit B